MAGVREAIAAGRWEAFRDGYRSALAAKKV
jgi:hypothetical protein